ncbi:DUF1653 domain-containing protein [Psychromonas sp. Urea-02u-13]|uniref:DUF1653 domain-containing protein n=1 Tax=Psychromonas sp. Urea-02u-13 TaxID=2058326 RepID=UPI000C33290F|nr:DUF1653 domain-containing protein [Psychromonas sp. Urea-02u-13]PKG37354.1 DUF1653 domain-containing protein [Psychromonas sp. Urea-02u-13]
MNSLIKLGKYKHYKGSFYQVEDIATHSETEEKMVVYRPLYGDHALWVRPLDMFIEEVNINGVMQPRFVYVDA